MLSSCRFTTHRSANHIARSIGNCSAPFQKCLVWPISHEICAALPHQRSDAVHHFFDGYFVEARNQFAEKVLDHKKIMPPKRIETRVIHQANDVNFSALMERDAFFEKAGGVLTYSFLDDSRDECAAGK